MTYSADLFIRGYRPRNSTTALQTIIRCMNYPPGQKEYTGHLVPVFYYNKNNKTSSVKKLRDPLDDVKHNISISGQTHLANKNWSSGSIRGGFGEAEPPENVWGGARTVRFRCAWFQHILILGNFVLSGSNHENPQIMKIIKTVRNILTRTC